MTPAQFAELERQAEVLEQHKLWRKLEVLRQEFVAETNEQPFADGTMFNNMYVLWLEKNLIGIREKQ